MSTENGKVTIFMSPLSLLLQCHRRIERLEQSAGSFSGLVCLDLKAELQTSS